MADGVQTAERWFTAAELAGRTGLPNTHSAVVRSAKRNGWLSRQRTGRGGGREYALSSLPAITQAALIISEKPTIERSRKAGFSAERIASIWQRYERVGQALQNVATQRLKALHAIEALVRSGMPMMEARDVVADQMQRDSTAGASSASIARWQASVKGAHRSDWLALLIPHYAGRTATATMEPAAWDYFKGDWLRLEQPSAESCYRRLQRVAATHPEWAPLPSLRTFTRRVERELPRGVRVLARQGTEAMLRTFPAQERDRSGFAAMDGVNADGHKWDVAVRFPDGKIGRPLIVGFQDLRAGKILSWRMDRSESSDLVRLAFSDMVQQFGIPRACWLDNGRAFASKYLTGGTPNRYRFKIREDDPVGIITGLGVAVHWVTPYHGQAKPIERAWRDFCDAIAKHPAFAGAYMGNNPTNKPENYGSRAVEWDDFVRVVNSEIAAHNAREGRRGGVCAGRSFDAVFAESYATAPIRKASSEQLRTLLLTAEAVTADRSDGSLRLSAGNRYWCEALTWHTGRKVVVRFDPMALHSGVHCYELDNTYIGYADCIGPVGFADSNAGREYGQAKNQFSKASKAMLDAERRMSAAQVAAQVPTMVPTDMPPAAVIEGVFGKPEKRAIAKAAEPMRRTGTDDMDSAGAMCARIAQERKRRFDQGEF